MTAVDIGQGMADLDFVPREMSWGTLIRLNKEKLAKSADEDSSATGSPLTSEHVSAPAGSDGEGTLAGVAHGAGGAATIEGVGAGIGGGATDGESDAPSAHHGHYVALRKESSLSSSSSQPSLSSDDFDNVGDVLLEGPMWNAVPDSLQLRRGDHDALSKTWAARRSVRDAVTTAIPTDKLSKSWQGSNAPHPALEPLDMSKVHRCSSITSDTATSYGELEPRFTSHLEREAALRAASARSSELSGLSELPGRGFASQVGPGDVMITTASGRLEQIGAVGGFMGHALLVLGRPIAIARGSGDAEGLGSFFALAGGAKEIWRVRTLESTRNERTLHRSDALLHVDSAGKVYLIGEQSIGGQTAYSVDGDPCKVEFWQSPAELRSLMRPELLDQVVAEMTAREAGWSLATAARALLFSSRLPDSTMGEDHLMSEIRAGWDARPICTSVVISFWQRYLCHLGKEPRTPRASTSIMRWIPLRADRALPGELLTSLAECGWMRVNLGTLGSALTAPLTTRLEA